MAKKPKRYDLRRELISLIWWIPLLALPFALFFLLVTGQPWSAFSQFYAVSFVFSVYESLANVFANAVIVPLLRERYANRTTAQTLSLSLAHFIVSLLAAAAAALTLRYTLLPDFFGDARSVIVLLVYTLLFGVLFLATGLGWQFYRRAVERAGSDRDLVLARQIQRSFLLSDFPRRTRIDVHAENLSSREVSGDFYDVVETSPDELLIAIADVSGKGVPAALLSSMLQASLRTQAAPGASTAGILVRLNRLACQRTATGQFATCFLASIHEPSLTLRFTNAGHNFPVLQRADGTRTTLEEGGLVVGMLEDQRYREGVHTLAPGDLVLLYTDGVTEAANADGEMFGEERLEALLATLPPAQPAAGAVAAVLDAVRTFLGETEPGDDITVMAVRIRA